MEAEEHEYREALDKEHGEAVRKAHEAITALQGRLETQCHTHGVKIKCSLRSATYLKRSSRGLSEIMSKMIHIITALSITSALISILLFDLFRGASGAATTIVLSGTGADASTLQRRHPHRPRHSCHQIWARNILLWIRVSQSQYQCRRSHCRSRPTIKLYSFLLCILSDMRVRCCRSHAWARNQSGTTAPGHPSFVMINR
jgi:hypothetical protein